MKNIFARELQAILNAHNKNLSSLFGLRVPDPRAPTDPGKRIGPSKVTQLKDSLLDGSTATLNEHELQALQDWVPLDKEGKQLRCLRAALVAEGVRYLLAGRMRAEEAYEVSDLIFQILNS